MIGWFCDAGYALSEVTNISDITFTDTHKPFCFATTSGNGFSYDGRPGASARVTCADGLLGSLGQDYYTVFMPCSSGVRSNSASIANLDIILPSYDNSFPNLYDYIKSLSGVTTVVVWVYIKSLNIAILFTSGGTSLFNVSSNGSVTRVSNVPSNQSIMQVWENGCRFIGVTDLDSDAPTVYVGYNFESGNRLIAYYLPSSNTDIITWVRYFLGLGKPDFENEVPPPNPYEPGGPSGPTDPDLPPGTFDDDSDPIPDSPLPTLSAANTGFTRIYNPTLSQVQALARYLWTDPDVIQTIWNHIKQFFENPMEAIIGFNLVPVPVPDGGIENFALMYIDTGVSMMVAANQFVDLDCGTLELKRYYGSALDQSPYTKVSCYLPYIGTVNLNTDEVMGTTLQVKYRVDIVSGSCVAKIFVDGSCLYQYSGHCAITIPISSADFSSYVSAAISVGKLAAAAITAGAGAAVAAGVSEVSQQTNQVVTTTQTTNTARNPMTGRQITTGTITTVETRQSPVDQSSTQASFSGLSPQNVSNTVGTIMSSKPQIEHSGSFSGNSGYLGVRRPFVIIERPNMCMPANYQALNGFPSMITMELSTCKGFTRVQQVQLTGLNATNPEHAEILELLKSGVIL